MLMVQPQKYEILQKNGGESTGVERLMYQHMRVRSLSYSNWIEMDQRIGRVIVTQLRSISLGVTKSTKNTFTPNIVHLQV